MENWIIQQTDINVSQFDKAMEVNYPKSTRYTQTPKGYYKRIVEESNYFEAIKIIDWGSYLTPGTIILDLGGGIGWLSAYLSKFDDVGKIIFLNSSKYFLNTMMPAIFKIMEGKVDKIRPIEGLFHPLLLQNSSVDIVVICSALHHAENIENVLKNVHRVLRKGGMLFILNETPYSSIMYVCLAITIYLKIMKDIIFHRYKPVSKHITASGILYDPYLGDWTYPRPTLYP